MSTAERIMIMAEYIERETIKAAMIHYGFKSPDMTVTEFVEDELPAADVAPVVHGRWVPTKAPFMNECEDCSVCGYRTVWGHRYNYCPNCGAKMDGGDSDEAD